MQMNQYYAFIKAIETGSFTKAAEELGYTQSAVSQMIHTLEKDLSATLIIRSRTGITLTPDGVELLPFIRKICNSHRELLERRKEMEGLESGLIRIGAFSSVSSHWLPRLMKDFKEKHPAVHFELHQGDYTDISNWIKEGSVDFGFVNPYGINNLTTIKLQEDDMLAVLPLDHPLASLDKVPLQQLTNDPFILLKDGEISEALTIFNHYHFEPNIHYHVHDDYTIMSMIEQGLGISILPKLVLQRCPYQIVTKQINPPFVRTISLAYKDKRVLPIACRHFIDFILQRYRKQ